MTNCKSHCHTAAADLLDRILNGNTTGVTNRFTETGIQTMNHNVDVLITIRIEIGHTQEMLEELLLRPLKV